MASKPKRPRDPNQLAKLVVDIATGEVEDTGDDKDMAAQAMGRKGGRARAEKVSLERRRETAQKAAKKRWATEENGLLAPLCYHRAWKLAEAVGFEPTGARTW